MGAIPLKPPIQSRGSAEVGSTSSSFIDALTLYANEQENNQRNLLSDIFEGITRAETWVSNWPEKHVVGVANVNQPDRKAEFAYAGRFKVENGKTLNPTFILGSDYRPSKRTQPKADPQYWVHSATNSMLNSEQRASINTRQFYQGDQSELPVAVTVMKINVQDRSIIVPSGQKIKANFHPQSRYVIFARGRMSENQYSLTTNKIPGTGEEFLPDAFYLELSSEESIKAFLKSVGPNSKVLPEVLASSLSIGISNQAKLTSIKDGNVDDVVSFAHPSNKNNPFSPKIKFILQNNSGIPTLS